MPVREDVASHEQGEYAIERPSNRLAKRIFDVFFASIGLLIASPFLLIIAALVAIENQGSVIFAHRRIGRGGKSFRCYKFQTMVPDAQEKLLEYLAKNPEAQKEWDTNFKLVDDPRVTKLGGFLRRTSLDELLQLWNVILNDMSLVGPRPIVTAEIERYGDNFKEYSLALPGITGIWQVSGRSDTSYDERVAMDVWYVKNWSLLLDIKCLFKTVKAVLKSEGAY